MKSIIQGIAGNRIISRGFGRISLCYREYQNPIEQILKTKRIMFYRDGPNDTPMDICYKICSGSNDGTAIQLFGGRHDGNIAIYPKSWKDQDNKIWVSALFRDGGGQEHYNPLLIYTYPNSCNSWKSGNNNGGWDYWYTPNGVQFASGSNTHDVRNSVDGVLTNDVCENYNLTPYRLQNYSAEPPNCISTPSRDLVACFWSSNTTSNGKYSVGLWYLSSNKGTYGTWYHTYSLSGNHISIPIILRNSDTVVAIMHSANILVGMKSVNWGRTWGKHSSLSVAANIGNPTKYSPGWNVGYGNGYHYFIGQSTPSNDNYVRFICTHHSGNSGVGVGLYYGCAASSTTHIMKLDLQNMTIVDDVCSSEYGSGSAYHMYVGCGDTYNNIYIWNYAIGAAKDTYGKTAGGMSNGSAGDIRHLHWYNDLDGSYGYVKFDTSTGYLWTSHCGGAVRFDKRGNLWGCGAGYFGTPEGAVASKGHKCYPDMMSGNSSIPSVSTWTEVNSDVATTDGGVGGSFEILENR